MNDQPGSLRPLTSDDFAKIAEEIRGAERLKTIPDDVRDLFAAIAQDIRLQVPHLDEQDIARVLITVSCVIAVAVERDGNWTAQSIYNTLASVGQRFWHGPAAEQAPAIAAQPHSPADPESFEERMARHAAQLETIKSRLRYDLQRVERTPDQWCAHYTFTIIDGDAWREAPELDWDAPISLAEFRRRAWASTSNGLVSGAFDRIDADLNGRTTEPETVDA